MLDPDKGRTLEKTLDMHSFTAWRGGKITFPLSFQKEFGPYVSELKFKFVCFKSSLDGEAMLELLLHNLSGTLTAVTKLKPEKQLKIYLFFFF